MSKENVKISRKLLSVIMALIMLISMVPASLVALALEDEYEYLEAKNLSAVYDAESDSIVVTWDAIQGDLDGYDINIDSSFGESIDDTSTTTYTFDSNTVKTLSGGQHTVNLIGKYETNEKTANTKVTLPFNLTSVGGVSAIYVANDLSISQIVAKLPTSVSLIAESKTVSADVAWNTEGTTYDKSKSEAQTFNVVGNAVLPANVINRDNVSLEVSATVNVAAATDASITTDILEEVSKKVDDSLSMEIAASGTGVSYMWYKNGEAISGANAANYSVEKVSLEDNGAQYYCVVTGKNGSTVQSKTLTLTVTKVNTNVELSITPTEQARPGEIVIEAIGLPQDATGSLEFKAKGNLIGNVTLPNNAVSFKALGAIDEYNISVEYSGNDVKYNSSNSTVDYSFIKGTQYVEFDSSTVISNTTYGTPNFTVKAKNTDNKGTGKFEFSVIDETRVDNDTTPGCVAKINSETGEVTIKNAGTFKIQVKAKKDDDYNESAAVSTDIITVNRAEQGAFAFEAGKDEMPYYHNFNEGRELESTGSGDGEITYALDTSVMDADNGFEINPATGKITFKGNNEDNNTELKSTIGVVKVVATKAADNQYLEKSTSYTFTVVKADQAAFEFENQPPADGITYTENNGTTYTNTIGTKKGSVYVNNDVVYSIAAEVDLDDASIAVDDLAEIDSSTGEITAKRSGTLTVKASLAGNNVYNPTEATYTITINRGEIEGFNFAKTDAELLVAKYGVKFENKASGGQNDASGGISYEIESVSDAIKDYIQISDNGILNYHDNYAKAEDADEYTVTVKATKAQDEKYLAKPIKYTLKIKRDVVTSDDFLLNGEKIKDSDEWYNATAEKIVITPDGLYNKISTDGENWLEKLEYPDDKVATISFYLKNDDKTSENCGAVTKFTTQTYNYDKTYATAKLTIDNNFWDKFLETITFGLWKKESKKVLIEATDNLSGIASIEYFEQNSDFDDEIDNFENISWNQCDEKDINRSEELKASCNYDIMLNEDTNKKVVVYVKITDVAGNSSYFRTDGMIFDNISPNEKVALSQEPIINIKLPNSSNEEGLYNGDVPFRLTVTDPKEDASGIKDIKVTISGKGSDRKDPKIINITTYKSDTEYYSEVTSFDSSKISDEFTVDETFVVPKEFNSNHITILVEGTDYSGNKFDNSDNLTYLAIDTTNPVIDVKYTASNGGSDAEFSNGKYIGNNQNRKATITITELNFDPSNVVIDITRDGEKIQVAPKFEKVGDDLNGDPLKWAMDIDFAPWVKDGGNEFTFAISCTDKAGHKTGDIKTDDIHDKELPKPNYQGDNPNNFIIDNTKPIISVNITNNDVKNGKYFKADRTATITIKERYFDPGYSFDWSGLTYSLNGTFRNAPTPVLVSSNNNTYIRTYRIDFTAEGDYTFDVKYTDLADNLANTYGCNSVSYREFTVDKTAPTLDITGVANQSANNGTIAPVVSYSDINLDADTVSVVLSGVNNGTVNYSNTVSKEAQKGSVTYADFERVKKVDDIYTLNAKLSDKAGNETTKAISFSANRFGSTYRISKAIENLNGTYVKKAEDVVFTEVNANRLSNIKITLFKNNATIVLTEGKDYKIDIVGGNGYWYEYTYTVFAKNFADDGVYRIVFHSEDEAGNVAENILDTKDMELGFGVDKTAPNIIVTNLENGKTYPLERLNVVMTANDNLILSSVVVYLDDYNKAYKSWSEKEIAAIIADKDEFTFEVPGESTRAHNVKVVCTDAAGNEKVEEIQKFYVTTNLFVRYFNNKPLFYGTVGGLLLVIGLVVVLIKKKKNAKSE